MKSELIVDVQPTEVSIALLEDSRLVSLQKEQRNIAYAVGDIYLAKVKKLMPGLNAAFVNVGYEKDGFLHYLDLGPHFSTYKEFLSQLLKDKRKVPSISKMDILPDIDKHGIVTDQLQPGQEIMVQIVKEPISSKGPRLTTEISFTGRYMVLTPFNDKISISQKIKTTEEKSRLRQLISSIKPKNFGVIVRTSAEGKRVAELINEMKTLLQCWEDTCAKCQKADVPSLIFEEQSRIVGMLRDVFSPSFESIIVNDKEVGAQIRNYVAMIAPEKKEIVKIYERPEPIFDTFGVTRQVKSSFGKTVSFKAGSYLIIEHTEALHVIDVNSGNRTKAGMDQESNALDVNIRAADEIARQLRLRDMGGIIVIDFIDMAKNEHRQQVFEHMKEVMANDRARHNILPLSKFGLMQITRQRVRPAMDIVTDESCPSCSGKERIPSSLLFTDVLYDKLEFLCNELNVNNFTLYVHPYVEAYIKKGWLMSLASKWKRQLGKTFRIIADQSLAYLQYRVVDKDGNVVDLAEEKDAEKTSRYKKERKKSLLNKAIEEEEAKKEAEEAKKKKETEAANTKTVENDSTPSSSSRRATQKQRQQAVKKNLSQGDNLPTEHETVPIERPDEELLPMVVKQPNEEEKPVMKKKSSLQPKRQNNDSAVKKEANSEANDIQNNISEDSPKGQSNKKSRTKRHKTTKPLDETSAS